MILPPSVAFTTAPYCHSDRFLVPPPSRPPGRQRPEATRRPPTPAVALQASSPGDGGDRDDDERGR